MAKKKSSIEGRGLLQPEEFDIDDLDYLDSSNGHARSGSKDWSQSQRNRRGRWFRSKCLCWTFFILVLLLIGGAALNKGGKLKIPELPGKPSPVEEPTQPSLPDEPEKPNLPEEPEPPTQLEPPMEPESATVTSTSTLSTSTVEASGRATLLGSSTSADSAHQTATLNATTIDLEALKPSATAHLTSQDKTSKDDWEKPKGFKIIGLLFYGRPDTVAILDCYLRKNLVSNGGWLDEVHFVINTEKQDDIDWLDLLLDEVHEYKKVKVDTHTHNQVDGYNVAWATCNKKDMYIKIDDDIVFFDDNAIPNLVFSLMNHPEALNVVSTLINSPETGWLHFRLGAIHAYLPELSRKKEDLGDFEGYGPKAWRASALPKWEGKEMSFPVSGVGMGKDDGYVRLPEDNPGAPPYKGHRWLPLAGNDTELWRTPSAQSKYHPDGPDWASWSLGAQAHYSFLQNLENDNLDIYRFGAGMDPKREGIWNMAYERMNINFMAIWGKDVKANLPFPGFDDELALSVQVPEKLRRRKFAPETIFECKMLTLRNSFDCKYSCYRKPFPF